MSSPGGRQIQFTIQVVVEPDDDGYHAYCPALKGFHVGGETEAEALENAKDAAIAYVCSLIKHGEPIPVGVTIADPCATHHHQHKEARCHTFTEQFALSPA